MDRAGSRAGVCDGVARLRRWVMPCTVANSAPSAAFAQPGSDPNAVIGAPPGLGRRSAIADEIGTQVFDDLACYFVLCGGHARQ